MCAVLISATTDNQLFTKHQMASCSPNACIACDSAVSDTIGNSGKCALCMSITGLGVLIVCALSNVKYKMNYIRYFLTEYIFLRITIFGLKQRS